MKEYAELTLILQSIKEVQFLCGSTLISDDLVRGRLQVVSDMLIKAYEYADKEREQNEKDYNDLLKKYDRLKQKQQ